MASAASTTSFSMVLICRSTDDAMVGGGCCDCCACGADDEGGGVLDPPWAKAATAKVRTSSRESVLMWVIREAPVFFSKKVYQIDLIAVFQPVHRPQQQSATQSGGGDRHGRLDPDPRCHHAPCGAAQGQPALKGEDVK